MMCKFNVENYGRFKPLIWDVCWDVCWDADRQTGRPADRQAG